MAPIALLADYAFAMKLLLDFSDEAHVAPFAPVDDVVMGGQSQSQLHARAGHASFQGTVSLAQGGGFASVQCTLEADWSAYAWSSAARPRGWAALCLQPVQRPPPAPHRLSLPVRRAHRLGVHQRALRRPPAALSRTGCARRPIRSILPPCAGLSFLIGDKQEGTFRLDLAAIYGLPAEMVA